MPNRINGKIDIEIRPAEMVALRTRHTAEVFRRSRSELRLKPEFRFAARMSDVNVDSRLLAGKEEEAEIASAELDPWR